MMLEWRSAANLVTKELVLMLFLFVGMCEPWNPVDCNKWLMTFRPVGSFSGRGCLPVFIRDRERGNVAQKKQTVVCSGGASWIPWEGSNRPIIETDRDVVLKRERCALCSGTGKMRCRACIGKGQIYGTSRPLRLGNTDVGANERIIYDTSTGLSRAVEAKPCKECLETGTIDCQLCLGDGKRLDSRGYEGLKRVEQANVRLGIVEDESDQG